MIEITVNDIKVPLKNIWYHKKSNILRPQLYSIKLDMENHFIKKFFADYFHRESFDKNLSKLILAKEQNAGSLGLLWHLIQYFETNTEVGAEDPDKPYFTLNTVDNIFIENYILIIEGRLNSDNNSWSKYVK